MEAVFVGREREMHALLTCLEAAVAGQGRMVFLTGEAGIGKTRTALEFATLARSRRDLLWPVDFTDLRVARL